MIILLSACQTQDLKFVGDSENWSAEVTVTQTDGSEQYEIQINYKGSGIEIVKTFDYFVETTTNGVLNFSASNVTLNEMVNIKTKV